MNKVVLRDLDAPVLAYSLEDLSDPIQACLLRALAEPSVYADLKAQLVAVLAGREIHGGDAVPFEIEADAIIAGLVNGNVITATEGEVLGGQPGYRLSGQPAPVTAGV
jgi:hypothetical protein